MVNIIWKCEAPHIIRLSLEPKERVDLVFSVIKCIHKIQVAENIYRRHKINITWDMGANLDGIIEKLNKSRKLNIMNLHSYQPQDYVVPLPEAGSITAPGHILVDMDYLLPT